MTYPPEIVLNAGLLRSSGAPIAAISRELGVSRAARWAWLLQGFEGVAAERKTIDAHNGAVCSHVLRMEEVPREYSYLLGLYLGDGYICRAGSVYRLRIVFDRRYPAIIGEADRTMKVVMPNRVGRVRATGCLELSSYSKHWPCLFPQHGPGGKHERTIKLASWQEELALGRHPEAFVRGRCSRGAPEQRLHDLGLEARGCRAPGPDGRTQTVSQHTACPERDSNPHALSGNAF